MDVGVILRGRGRCPEALLALSWRVLGSFLNCLEYDPLENLMSGLNLRKSCTSTWL